MENQTKLKIALLTLMALGLCACGSSSTTGSMDLASRSTGTSVTDTSKAWVQCNTGSSASGTFDVRLATVKENNVIRNDLMYVRFSRVPSDFTSSGYFQMYRWQANTAGSLYTDPQPLAFELWDPQNSQMILSARTSVRWSDVSAAASSMGISDPTTFFKRVMMKVDLRDPTAQFDALMSVLYRADNTARDSANALLPVFDANPEHYATESNGAARHSSLMALHPFRDSIGQGWTTADFQSRANSLCAAF